MHPTDINEKIFSHFIADKIIFFIIISCNNIFDTNILSGGYLTKLRNYGKFQGVGDGKDDKHPLKGNSSGMEGAQALVPSVGRGEGRECIFSGTTHFGFTFGKSLFLNVVSISRLYSFVFNKSTHFFI